ncbi:RVT-2 multi-domain protein [Pyrenophora tritici-repentis]|nr:RVT-2 multi-domain protein [Pyrenophora tritici-repentis]
MLSQQEIAFTPKIDKIPTLLLANTELKAARAFAFVTAATTNLTISRCFATAIIEATTTDLPPKPATRKAARLHLYSKQWIAAEDEELVSLDQNGTWETRTTIPPGAYALPTKWVYKYKVKDDGQLERFKARLVVCGNRQETDFWRETYAAVARATTLKVLLALVATEDLECEQAEPAYVL